MHEAQHGISDRQHRGHSRAHRLHTTNTDIYIAIHISLDTLIAVVTVVHSTQAAQAKSTQCNTEESPCHLEREDPPLLSGQISIGVLELHLSLQPRAQVDAVVHTGLDVDVVPALLVHLVAVVDAAHVMVLGGAVRKASGALVLGERKLVLNLSFH